MHPAGTTSAPPAGRAAALLVAFLAVNFLLGLVSFEAFKVDDSDQILFSQSFEWGYHDHPPVYSWLCGLVFRVFGMNPVAYALLKTLVLAGIALTLFWACRLALGDTRRAALAAAVTLLIPTFSWHSLTYLTHTNLLFIACAGSAAVVFRLYRDGRTRDYVLLGLFAALGVYAKYSYPLFAAALALAGLTVPGFRARLLDRRLLLSLALAGAMLAPHLAWFADNHEWIVGWLSAKTGTDAPERSLANVGRGGLHLAQNVVVILALPLVILPLAFPQALRRTEQPHDLPGDANRLLGRFLLITAGLLVGLVVVGGTTRFHERWLQPFLVFAPVYFFGRLRGAAVPEVRLRRLGWLAVLAAAVLTGARATAIAVADLDRSNWPLRCCYESAVRQLRAEVGDDVTVVGVEREISGNLRWWWPQARHICYRHPLYRPAGAPGPRRYVVVWDATTADPAPTDLNRWLKKCFQQEPGLKVPAGAPLRVIELPPAPVRKTAGRLAYLVIEPGAAAAPDQSGLSPQGL